MELARVVVVRIVQVIVDFLVLTVVVAVVALVVITLVKDNVLLPVMQYAVTHVEVIARLIVWVAALVDALAVIMAAKMFVLQIVETLVHRIAMGVVARVV